MFGIFVWLNFTDPQYRVLERYTIAFLYEYYLTEDAQLITELRLTVPSYYLNRCWHLINGVLWHSPESKFTRSAQVRVKCQTTRDTICAAWSTASITRHATKEQCGEGVLYILSFVVTQTVVSQHVTSRQRGSHLSEETPCPAAHIRDKWKLGN